MSTTPLCRAYVRTVNVFKYGDDDSGVTAVSVDYQSFTLTICHDTVGEMQLTRRGRLHTHTRASTNNNCTYDNPSSTERRSINLGYGKVETIECSLRNVVGVRQQ
jgi:hypothetical protein